MRFALPLPTSLIALILVSACLAAICAGGAFAWWRAVCNPYYGVERTELDESFLYGRIPEAQIRELHVFLFPGGVHYDSQVWDFRRLQQTVMSDRNEISDFCAALIPTGERPDTKGHILAYGLIRADLMDGQSTHFEFELAANDVRLTAPMRGGEFGATGSFRPSLVGWLRRTLHK
ncbi:MAG TPA: hypothetical protein VMF30_00775 [Pirellulales bacterium]|nr:hypothetical protein [Pirellulales bacterium]